MLVVENVWYRARDGCDILAGISFEAAPGTLTAIIGPNGAGKTTLLRTVVGLALVTKGRIVNDYGQPGFVFQQPSLWPHLTLFENVSIALRVLQHQSPREAEQRALSLLDEWGLCERMGAVPAELSGGEQQRGAFARMCALQPNVMCLDEVTSALDPEAARLILEKIKAEKSKGTILLFATHDIQFVRACADQVVFIERGQVRERGQAKRIFDQSTDPRTREYLAAADWGSRAE